MSLKDNFGCGNAFLYDIIVVMKLVTHKNDALINIFYVYRF